jgi:hypothetical protein
MRQALIAASAALAIGTTAAQAQPPYPYGPGSQAPGLVATGVVTGTVVGLGLTEGWWGSSALATSLGSSTAAAATAGGVAGVGTIALLHAATTPCTGFDALLSPFRPGPSGCIDGRYVGAQAQYPGPGYAGPGARRRY